MSIPDLDVHQVFPSLTRALRAPVNGVITGPPGSGKTFFAIQLAEMMSARHSILLLVASDHLARAIRADRSRGGDFVVDTWRRRLRNGYVLAKGASTVPYRDDETRMVDWAAVAHELNAKQYWQPDAGDAELQIIIDEGQDVPVGLIRVLRGLGFPVCVMMDPEQRTTAEGTTLLDAVDALATREPWPVLLLEEDFRTTFEIQDFATKTWLPSRRDPGRPARRRGPRPTIVEGATHQIADLVRQQLVDEHVRSIAVAVDLDDRGVITSSLRSEGLVAASQTAAHARDVSVLHMESLRGLEFDAVIQVLPLGSIASKSARDAYFADQYVASTRARQHLTILMRDGVDPAVRERIEKVAKDEGVDQ